jgi:predicted nucleotidyltransferase
MDRKKELATIFKENSIKLAYLFGSQADVGQDIVNGKAVTVKDPLADVDLGIIFEQDIPSPEELPKVYANLYNRLAHIFLPLNLDLVFLQEQHSVFQANAVTGICIYFEDENFKSEYEESIMRRAADFRPFLERYLDERLKEVL